MISQLIFLFILILLNAYFAATEIAFISLNDAKIEKQAKDGNKKAKQIQKMLKNPSKFLATIQIGITLAGFLSSAFASDAFAGMLAPVLNEWMPFISIATWQNISIVIITIILSFFTLVFGELVPKRLAMKYYEKISFATIGVIKGISVVTAPFVKLLTWSTNLVSKIFGVGEQEEEIVTEEEIKMMVNQGEEKGSIEENEKELINNVFEFNDIIASEIMTYRTDIYAIEMNEDIYGILDEIDEYKYSRIPVYEETIDDIKGILFLKDILKLVSIRKEFKIADIMREAYFVPESKPIDEIFEELQANKMQMAIVVDEYGGTAGLLTMEDILEEIVGNILDEYDEDDHFIIEQLDNTYLMKGLTPLEDVEETLSIDLQEEEYETLNGYLTSLLGHIPNIDEDKEIRANGYLFTILAVENNTIQRVRVEKLPEEKGEEKCQDIQNSQT